VTDTIQQNRWDQLLRRVGGIIGPGSKVGSVVTDLFPMLDVERVPGELLALGGTRICFGGTSQAAFAGLTDQAQLFNPADSGTIITVTRLDITTSNTQKIAMGIVSAVLTPVANEQFRDSRLFGPLPVGAFSIATAAAGDPINQWASQVLANGTQAIEPKNGIAVLTPGFGLQVTTITQQTTLNIGWWWRERPAEQSELTL